MKTSAAGKNLIKQFEGFGQIGYALGDGVITAGWGSTSAHHPIQNGISYSTATLEQWFAEDLADYEAAVNRINQDGVFNQNQFDALVSFSYNLGSAVFYNDSALTTELRSGNPNSMILYCNPGSQFEAGLRRRRQAEIDLFNTPVEKLKGSIGKFQGYNWAFVFNKPFKADEIKKINGIWQAVNYDFAGGKKFVWTLNGIPLEILDKVDKNGKKTGDQNNVNPGDYLKFQGAWNHGTIDDYDIPSNGIGIAFGDFGEIWFNADYALNKI